MTRPKILKDPVILFVRIEASQNRAIEDIAKKSDRTKAAVVREAIDIYISGKNVGAIP